MNIRIEGRTAYVQSLSEAFEALELEGVENVVIEGNKERIRR